MILFIFLMVVIPLLIKYFQRNSQKRDFKKYSRKNESYQLFANVIIRTILNKKINHFK